MTKYNLYISTGSSTYNILDLSREKLDKILSAYKAGKTEFTIGGKKYWIDNLHEFQIFDVKSEIDSLKFREKMIEFGHAERGFGGGYYLSKKALIQVGKNVTEEILGDSEFGEDTTKEKKENSVKANAIEPFDEKKYLYLLHLADRPEEKYLHEILLNSKLFLETTFVAFPDSKNYNLHLSIAPETYKKYQDLLNDFKILVKDKIRITFNMNIENVHVSPDLQNFHVFANKYIPQSTPWIEINEDQNQLLKSLQQAQSILEYQNVGNIARTIMQKITKLVFNEAKHLAVGVDLGEDKYKNRLHTYIKTELQGNENKDFRHFAESIIASCEKAIDLSNTLTHDLKATAFMAESSVIGVLTSINIIRLIKAL